MATYTAHFNFYLPAEGDGILNGHTWGLQINDNFELIDTMLNDLTAMKAELPSGGSPGQYLTWPGNNWATPPDTAPAHASNHAPGGSDALPWGDIHGRGTTSSKPAATAANANFLYYDTDLMKLQQSTGTEWVDYEGASGSGGGGTGDGPWEYWEPRASPASPSTLDDEFSTSPLDAKWTTVNWSTPAIKDVNTTVPLALYMKLTTTGYTIPCVLQPIPAGDFTIYTRMQGQSEATNTSNAGGGIILSNGTTAGAGNQVMLNSLSAGVAQAWLYTWSNFSAAGSQQFLRQEIARYLRVRRVGTTYSWGTSEDGKTWTNVVYNPAFTPTHFGLFGYCNQTGSVHTSFDFFRYFPSGSAVLGALLSVNRA